MSNVAVPYGFGPTQTILDECAAHPNEESAETLRATPEGDGGDAL